jgi:hypothetical protein
LHRISPDRLSGLDRRERHVVRHSLERFRAKWTPVRVKKTRQKNKLAVEPQQVVLGLTGSADGCLRFYAAVPPMPIVLVQPNRKLLGATSGNFGLGTQPV